MKQFIIGSGWKMNNTIAEGLTLLTELQKRLGEFADFPLYVLPAFTALDAVGKQLKGSHLQFGAQNMHWETAGAYTGEISAPMLRELGVTYVELNHHERRTYFGETNATTNQKLHTAFRYGLTPILCIGEEERLDEEQTKGLFAQQLSELLADIPAEAAGKILYAYEPRWAIGKAAAAPPAYINGVHKLIRNILQELYGQAIAGKAYIIYGGSVNRENFQAIAREQEVNGLFIGRAGLDAAEFSEIILTTAHILKEES